MALASVLLVLGVFEIGLRLAGYEAIFDVYSRPSLFWIYDEELGWRHQPNAAGTYVGPRPWPIEYRTPIQINSLGLRGPEIAELPPGGYRILFLGDSFVVAFEVTLEETFVYRLERALAERFDFPVQVINAGVRGYGTDQSYLHYATRLRALEPDLVVLFHSPNDLEDNATLHRMRRPFGKSAFALRSDGSLEPVLHPVPRFPLCSSWVLDASFAPLRLDGPRERAGCWLQTRLSDHSALFTFLALRIGRNPGLLKKLYDFGAPEQAAAGAVAGAGFPAAAGAGFVPAAGGGPRVEPLPPDDRYALTTALYRELAAAARREGADFLGIVRDIELERFDRAALARDGVPVHAFRVDLRRTLFRSTDFHFKNDSHLNARGHQYIADHLTPVLAEAISASR
jgi:lysophospholipase L1-like esterase